jgi:hypothetical protein
MTARARRVLMPGTAPEGRRGAAALVALLRADGLSGGERICYGGTSRQASVLARLKARAGGFGRAIACLWRRPAIVHAHAALQASCARGSLLPWSARCAGRQTIFHPHEGDFRQFAGVRPDVPRRRRIRRTLERRSPVIARIEGRAGSICGLAPRARDRGAEPGRIPFPGRLERARGRAGLSGAATLPARRLQDAGLGGRRGGPACGRLVQHYSTEAICGRLAAIYNDLAGAR